MVAALDLRVHEAVVEHDGGAVERVPLTPNRPVAEVTKDVLIRAPATSSPAAAHWDDSQGEYVLDRDDVRAASNPGRRGGRARPLRLPARLAGARMGPGAA